MDDNFILTGVIDVLGNILSYINPFSENFFAYKLLELLGNLLYSLFIPSEGFFDEEYNKLYIALKEKLPVSSFIDLMETLKDYNTNDDSTVVEFEGYKVGDLTINNSNFINFGLVRPYRDTWFSWVRGFTYIALIIYNLNQIMKLFGHPLTDGSYRSIGSILREERSKEK